MFAHLSTRVLSAILRARYPKQPAGHWVVMNTNLAGVDLFVMIYVWSQKRMTVVVSISRKMIYHQIHYHLKFFHALHNTT